MSIPGMESSFSGVGHLRDELTSKISMQQSEINELRTKCQGMDARIHSLENQMFSLQDMFNWHREHHGEV